MAASAQLKRSISLPFLVLYGLGTMVGGGFYALLGKVAGEAGLLAPVALLLSGALALISAFSFAELSARYPVSAGEAHYVREGFGRGPAALVGWLVISTGVVSAATLSVATVGFLGDLIALPSDSLAIIGVVLALGAVCAWGVDQSVALVTIITIIEVGALLAVAAVAADNLGRLPDALRSAPTLGSSGAWLGLFSAAFLSFYSFVGFEDLVNMAEEVKEPERNLPRAILLCIVLTTVLYLLVSTVAVTARSPEALAASNTPIALIAGDDSWLSGTGLVVVSLLTGINGALVQIVMASRVAYGLARRGQAPRWLAIVNSKTQTPLRGTALMVAIVLTLALFLPLVSLAKITSWIILLVFAMVNLALWRIKGDDPAPTGPGPRYPRWLPLLGFTTCAAVLTFQGWLVLTGS